MTWKVTFRPSALAEMMAAAMQATDGLETGGILLGHDEGHAHSFIVRHCGNAGPGAVRTPTFFLRDLDHARKLADEVYAFDRSLWIGEWHTHGIDLPLPSTRDLLTYQRHLNDPDLCFARFLAVILLARPPGDWTHPELYAWSFTGTVLRALRIEVHDLTEGERADRPPEPEEQVE